MDKIDNSSRGFFSKANLHSMWLKRKKLFVILLMTIIPMFTFSIGYLGIGSDIIIVDYDNDIDCFFKDNPTGLNLFLDCYLMKQMLNSNTYEAISSSEYKLTLILLYHSKILQKISNDYKLTNPEIEELQKEISHCVLSFDKIKDK